MRLLDDEFMLLCNGHKDVNPRTSAMPRHILFLVSPRFVLLDLTGRGGRKYRAKQL